MVLGKAEVLYILLMGGAAGIGLIKTMAFGAYLSPRFMGYYSIALTVAGYGSFLQLGLMSGLNRELPVCLGRGREEHASHLIGETTIAVTFLQLMGITIFFLMLVIIPFKEESVRNACLLGGILAFSAPFAQMVLLRLRAEQRVMTFSLLQFINSLCMLLFGILAIQYFSYKGAIIAAVLINFACFIIVSRKYLDSVNYLYFRIKDISYLIRIGLPMMLAGIFVNLQLSMDRLFLIKNASVEKIGIYQIGIVPLTFGILLSSIVGQYVGPRLLFRYGQGKSLKYLFKKSLMVSLIVISCMFACWPLVPFSARYLIRWWLPDYEESVTLISIFYLGAIFTAANISMVTNAANRQVLNLYQGALITVMCFIGYMLITHYDMTLKWYAYMNVFSQVVGFLLSTVVSYYVAKNEHRNQVNLSMP